MIYFGDSNNPTYFGAQFVRAYYVEYVDTDLSFDRESISKQYYSDSEMAKELLDYQWVVEGTTSFSPFIDKDGVQNVPNSHGSEYKFSAFYTYDPVREEASYQSPTVTTNTTLVASWYKRHIYVYFDESMKYDSAYGFDVTEGYSNADLKREVKIYNGSDYAIYLNDTQFRVFMINNGWYTAPDDGKPHDPFRCENYHQNWYNNDCVLHYPLQEDDIQSFEWGWDNKPENVAAGAPITGLWIRPVEGLRVSDEARIYEDGYTIYTGLLVFQYRENESAEWRTLHTHDFGITVRPDPSTVQDANKCIVTYDYNGGSFEGLGTETAPYNCGTSLTATRENMLYGMVLPESKDIDYFLVNGQRYEIGSKIVFNTNMTVKYMWKTISAVQVDPEPTPVVPTVNLSESREERATQTTATVSWNKNPDAKGYFVYRKSGSKWKKVATIKNVNTTTYTNKKLKAGTNYTYKISAYTTYKKKKKTKYTTISTTDPVTVLTAPAAPKASIKGSTFDSVKVGYKGVKGTYKYEIFRSTSKKGTYEKVGESTTTSYTDTGLKTGTTYYYKVRACNNNCGGFSKVVSKKPGLAKPGLSVSSPEAGKVLVRPSTVAGEDGYVIQFSTKKNKGFKEVANLDVYTTEYLEEGFKSKKTFYFRVRAYRVVDGVPVYSAWSKVKKVKIK
jgi:hypothetical protein